MQDQRQWWDTDYRRLGAVRETAASRFAVRVAGLLAPGSTLLELGCGPGDDSAFFARAGHRVLAADFASNALARARSGHASTSGPDFLLLDMSAPLPFRDQCCDAVYARLSLHYFTDEVTRGIFAEIRRVLRPGGLLAFICKSTGDPLYGQGEAVGQDMFELKGKVRHFFSEAYARDLLAPGFYITELSSGPEEVYGGLSDIVTAIASRAAAPAP
jgi:ubiquinone/menaquinone biosynthesis C-methylase UbiE